MERLVRVETLLEQIALRQAEQHDENRRVMAEAAQATREHRHSTANAMSDVRGRLGEIKGVQARQAEQIDEIIGITKVATRERGGLDERLKRLEMIVTGVKSQWKTIAALMGAVGLFAGFVAGIGRLVGAVSSWLRP